MNYLFNFVDYEDMFNYADDKSESVDNKELKIVRNRPGGYKLKLKSMSVVL